MSFLALVAALLPAAATLQASNPGVAVRGTTLQGLPLCVWNDSSIFTRLKPGIQEHYSRVFRFPNGSYSDIYHWNSKGSYDADSVWVPDNSSDSVGWASHSIHGGLTSAPAYSLIDDGDTSTYWWSNPDVPDAPGWFVLDLGASTAIDSFALWLGSVRPDAVEIVRWTGGATYPVPYQPTLSALKSASWASVAKLPVTGGFVGLKMPSAIHANYIGVRPAGRKLANGWQAAEFQAFSGATQVTVNSASTSQTAVYAVSAHPSARSTNATFTWNFDTYMKWIGNYAQAIPMVCVNFGTGTAQEAAAWVHYANKVKGYGVQRWQVGNENSYYWEEGGCVSARQYAIRFVKYAQAMKAEDPTIRVYGPVYAGTDFTTQSSGDFDGRSWMEGFLHYVDSAEKASQARLLDGIDFHTYPYWFTSSPSATSMLSLCDGNGDAFDTLTALMGRTIADPTGREVIMSEFNVSSASGSIEMETSAGTGAGLLFSHFIQRFGDRGLTNLWELNSELVQGSDGTYGSLGAFAKPTQGEKSSLSYPPNASFWTTRTIMRQWLDTAGGDTIVPIDPIAGARLFAVRNHGRVSVLAFNLGADSVSVALDASLFPNGGDVLSWGTGEYQWVGTDAVARAIPDNGPSSHAFATWAGQAKIPPYGMLVVRAAGRGTQPLRTVHWLASATHLSVQDTLVVTGWTTSEGTTIQSGTWSAGAQTGSLSATDGAWDGPSESWSVKVPASSLAQGTQTFKYAIQDARGGIVTDSVDIEVTGTARPVLLIADFEKKLAVTKFNDSAWYYFGTTGNTHRAKIDSTGRGSWFLKDSMTLVLDATIGYTYQSAALPMPSSQVIDSLNALYQLVGIVFDISTKQTGTARGDFVFSADLPESMTGYNSHGTALPNTNGAWVTDTILFSNLTQAAGWGTICDFVLDSVKQMQFRSNAAGTSVVKIDNIAFLGTMGDDYHVPVRTRARSNAFAVVGGRMVVGVEGPWSVQLLAVNGRVVGRWSGSGAASLPVPASGASTWAVLQSAGLRRVQAIPPVVR